MTSILNHAEVCDAALPISVAQYHELGEAGIIPQATELLRGLIVEIRRKSPEHSWLVQFLADWLKGATPAGWHVRQEQPLTLADSEPEPDVALVAGRPADYRAKHPATAALVIEVAIWSEALDREKAGAYAEAGVEECWLVLPNRRAVEILSGPSATGYQGRRLAGVGEAVVLEKLPGVRLVVDDCFRECG